MDDNGRGRGSDPVRQRGSGAEDAGAPEVEGALLVRPLLHRAVVDDLELGGDLDPVAVGCSGSDPRPRDCGWMTTAAAGGLTPSGKGVQARRMPGPQRLRVRSSCGHSFTGRSWMTSSSAETSIPLPSVVRGQTRGREIADG